MESVDSYGMIMEKWVFHAEVDQVSLLGLHVAGCKQHVAGCLLLESFAQARIQPQVLSLCALPYALCF
jgi:hypothetical protein